MEKVVSPQGESWGRLQRVRRQASKHAGTPAACGAEGTAPFEAFLPGKAQSQSNHRKASEQPTVGDCL